MAACEDRVASLVDAAAGELPPGAERQLRAHLETCAGCREELSTLSQTEALLLETSRAPDELHLTGFAYRAADRAEAFRDRSARGLWWSITRGARIAMGFSTTALVASLALFVSARTPAPRLPVSPVAADVESSDDDIAAALNAMDGDDLSDDSDDRVASVDPGFDSLPVEQMNALGDVLDGNQG